MVSISTLRSAQSDSVTWCGLQVKVFVLSYDFSTAAVRLNWTPSISTTHTYWASSCTNRHTQIMNKYTDYMTKWRNLKLSIWLSCCWCFQLDSFHFSHTVVLDVSVLSSTSYRIIISMLIRLIYSVCERLNLGVLCCSKTINISHMLTHTVFHLICLKPAKWADFHLLYRVLHI